mmetsp:Transcript_15496/g.25117  ORF Transcript_15496/g.25117 Transcript_15496/m.25117 type:complete len:357 (+) Transcript_15496:77-1147(+)
MIIARTSLSLLVATTLYVAAILFLKAAEPGLRTDSGYKRKLKKIEAFGANPTNRYPLDRCQGDCDVDAHCKNGLVCFQRKGHEAVPGCSGGTSDSSRSDYCIDPSDVDGGQPNHNEAEPPKENKDNPPLNFLGVNPAKKDFPLQECEGDCDKNSDCAAGLICMQRESRNTPIPGCSGIDNSLTDYCVQRSDNEPNVPERSVSSSISDFALKLYWQSGYRWQEEDFERKWCMECRGGTCDYGDKTYIETCGSTTSQRYDFVFVDDNYAMIRLHGSNLCFERVSYDIFLYGCDLSNQRQHWYAQQGDFRGSKFEISPRGMGSRCVTQRHHPKADEEVELETCDGARRGDTSYWTRYYN